VIPPFPATAAFRAGRLRTLGGVDVDELAQQHGTPLYVVDEAELRGRMRAYRRAFGDGVAVTYAAKALCVTGVLQIAAAEGLHLDVASGGELHTAVRAGFPAGRIIFHGNNKSVAELEQAVRVGVRHVVVDSFAELERLDALGRARMRAGGAPVPVLLRITPGIEAHTHEFISTGQDDSKFGFTLSAGLADAAVASARDAQGLALAGLHCHVGSQVTVPEAFDAVAEVMVGVFADVQRRHGVALSELNLGGGLGIAYEPHEEVLDVATYGARLLAGVHAACARRGMPVPRLAVEPGRSIVGPAGVTLYRVGTRKEIPGVRTYVSVDGGMSDNLRPALYGARYTFAAAGAPADGADRTDGADGADGADVVTVAGKHCESGDVLGRDVLLAAPVAEGDLLAVAATGAYGHAMASNYNRLARPAMVLVGHGRTRVLVRRETLDDVVARDVVLSDVTGDEGATGAPAASPYTRAP